MTRTKYHVSADGFTALVDSLDQVRTFVHDVDARHGRARRVYVAKVVDLVVVAEKVCRENWTDL